MDRLIWHRITFLGSAARFIWGTADSTVQADNPLLRDAVDQALRNRPSEANTVSSAVGNAITQFFDGDLAYQRGFVSLGIKGDSNMGDLDPNRPIQETERGLDTKELTQRTLNPDTQTHIQQTKDAPPAAEPSAEAPKPVSAEGEVSPAADSTGNSSRQTFDQARQMVRQEARDLEQQAQTLRDEAAKRLAGGAQADADTMSLYDQANKLEAQAQRLRNNATDLATNS